MDLRLMPTVTDLAKMLDSIGSCRDGEYPETLHMLRWLIERSPAARELYDRLHARHHREPSLIELARLILAVEIGEPYPEAVYIVRRMIQCSGPAAEHYHRLEQLATDAGLEDRETDWAVRSGFDISDVVQRPRGAGTVSYRSLTRRRCSSKSFLSTAPRIALHSFRRGTAISPDSKPAIGHPLCTRCRWYLPTRHSPQRHQYNLGKDA